MIKIRINSKHVENRTILNNKTIEIKKGSFNIITGPSGVGKSTLLNIIGLLDHEFFGEYFFLGEKIDVKNNHETTDIRKKYFGFTFQDSLINMKQNTIRNLLCSVSYNELKEARKKVKRC